MIIRIKVENQKGGPFLEKIKEIDGFVEVQSIDNETSNDKSTFKISNLRMKLSPEAAERLNRELSDLRLEWERDI